MKHLVTCALLALNACDTGTTLPQNKCLSLQPSQSNVVARVGQQALDNDYLLKRLHDQGPEARGRYSDPLRLKRFVEDQVRFELLVQAAKERGLDQDPEVVEAARKVMVRKLLLQDLGSQALGGDANEEAVRAYYESHKDDYAQPEARRVSHIQLAPTPDGKARAQSLIDALRDKDDATRKHWKLAVLKESLDNTSKSRGGEIASFITQDKLALELGASFAQLAFAAKVGEIAAAPVQSTRGWHVMLVVADRAAQIRSLEEARPEIQDKLLANQRSQHFETYLRDIRQRHPVAVYEDQLPLLKDAFVAKETP